MRPLSFVRTPRRRERLVRASSIHAKLTPIPKKRNAQVEWRALGVQQSRGWIHYAIHKPEPHIMLFRRPLNFQQQQNAHGMANASSIAA